MGLIRFEVSGSVSESGARGIGRKAGSSGARLLDGATARGWFDLTGLIDDTGEFFNDVLGGETLGFGKIDERYMSTAEELFHFFGGAAWVFGVVLDAVFELDNANGAQGTLIAKDKINGFVFNEFVSGITVLGTDFVAQEGRDGDFGDNVEFLTKEVVEHLEALFGGANHEVLAGAIFEAVHGITLATTSGDSSKYRDQKQ